MAARDDLKLSGLKKLTRPQENMIIKIAESLHTGRSEESRVLSRKFRSTFVNKKTTKFDPKPAAMDIVALTGLIKRLKTEDPNHPLGNVRSLSSIGHLYASIHEALKLKPGSFDQSFTDELNVSLKHLHEPLKHFLHELDSRVIDDKDHDLDVSSYIKNILTDNVKSIPQIDILGRELSINTEEIEKEFKKNAITAQEAVEKTSSTTLADAIQNEISVDEVVEPKEKITNSKHVRKDTLEALTKVWNENPDAKKNSKFFRLILQRFRAGKMTSASALLMIDKIIKNDVHNRILTEKILAIDEDARANYYKEKQYKKTIKSGETKTYSNFHDPITGRFTKHSKVAELGSRRGEILVAGNHEILNAIKNNSNIVKDLLKYIAIVVNRNHDDMELNDIFRTHPSGIMKAIMQGEVTVSGKSLAVYPNKTLQYRPRSADGKASGKSLIRPKVIQVMQWMVYGRKASYNPIGYAFYTPLGQYPPKGSNYARGTKLITGQVGRPELLKFGLYEKQKIANIMKSEILNVVVKVNK